MTVVTARQMKEIEEASLRYDLTWARLMENAGSAASAFIRRTIPPGGRNCIVFCGRGNNGGDGFVVARRLKDDGANVLVVLVEGLPQSEHARAMFDMLELLELPIWELERDLARIEACLDQADIIVDAVYGTGFHGELPELPRLACRLINKAIAAVVALDLPSGVACDSGTAAEGAVNADFTVAFDCLKPLHILPSCQHFCGTVEVVDIGIPPEAHEGIQYLFGTVTEDMVWPHLPPRSPEAHKGSFGRLLAICGSDHYRGAAVLSASAALRCGVGAVTLAAPEAVCAAVVSHTPECILLPLPTDEEGMIDTGAAVPLLRGEMERATAILFGPGLGNTPATRTLLIHLLRSSKVPLIIDADGINALSENIYLLQEANAPIILTPHPGEMARLCGCTVPEVEGDRQRIAMQFAADHRVTVVLKGHRTVIAPATGGLYLNPTGNPGLAKAGSGDVLAGMLGAFTAGGNPMAAVCAVYLHGLAGDYCAVRRGEYSMLPSELLDDLCTIFSEAHGQV